MLNNVSREFLTIADYLKNGGEAYTLEELLLMLNGDIVLDEEKGKSRQISLISVIEIKKCIEEILIPYAGLFAWNEFGDRGNSCYNPYIFDNPQEEVDAVLTRTAVLLAMPKGSHVHITLARVVAKAVDSAWVTYDWLAKIVARLLSGTSYNDLKKMVTIASAVQNGMKRKGLKEIHSIEEALC